MKRLFTNIVVFFLGFITSMYLLVSQSATKSLNPLETWEGASKVVTALLSNDTIENQTSPGEIEREDQKFERHGKARLDTVLTKTEALNVIETISEESHREIEQVHLKGHPSMEEGFLSSPPAEDAAVLRELEKLDFKLVEQGENEKVSVGSDVADAPLLNDVKLSKSKRLVENKD